MAEHTNLKLKGSTAGMQFAGWTPGPPVMSGLGQRMLPDQRIPVSGGAEPQAAASAGRHSGPHAAAGAELHADVYLPEVPGRYPAVVSFAAYSTERHTAGIPTGSNEIGSPPVFTDRGYAPVIVERRGMGRSTGEQVPFFDQGDVDDHERVIAWAAEQEWCNGEVVLFGTSYYAMTQPVVAARHPPALKAFFANEMCTDFFRHLVQFGGVPALHFLNIWMGANFTQAQYDQRMSPDARAAASHVTNGPLHPLVEKALHHNVDAMFERFSKATPVKEVLEIYAQWLFDVKGRSDPGVPVGSNGVLDRIDIPFVVVQNLGYFNLHQFGSYDLFENSATAAGRKWMILTPPTYDLPVYSWQGEALAFFDHVLRGAAGADGVSGTPGGYAAQPAVRYWVEGAERFAHAASFPPPEATTKRFSLGSNGPDSAVHRLEAEPVPGEEQTRADESAPGEERAPMGSNSWAAVPIALPVLGGLDTVANQTLTFEHAVAGDIHLAGAVTVQLEFSCNEIDSYVVARLSRIDRTGMRHHLSMGAIRPAARTVDEERSTSVEIAIDSGKRVPLVPGKPVTLRFSLTPAPTQMREGDILRLDIASRTDLLRMSPADGYAQFDLPAPPYLCRNTVHFGGLSFLEVDTVDSAGGGLQAPED